VAVGRFLGIPLSRQVAALARPALVTVLLLVAAREVAPDAPTLGWLGLVPVVGATAVAATGVALVLGLNGPQRRRLVSRARAVVGKRVAR
jgi:hypothetical protein